MSIIVNDRDTLLQGATPRVEQVGLPPNVAIDPSNVPGLAAAFDATKEVSLSTTSQVFVVPKVGAIQPAAIEITALLKSITGTPTFTLVDGTLSFSVSGNKITILGSSMTSATATIEVSVLFNSVTYKDKVTIGKIAEGSDAVVGLLSNESCTVAASDSGVVSGAVLATAGGTFSIFDGVINKTTSGSVTYSVPSETGCDLSITSAGVYTVNSISSNSGNAVLRAVYTRGTNTFTIDKVYSVAKAIAGIVGSNAKLLYLSASSQIFQIPKSGSVTPSAITLTATAQNLDQAAAYTWTTTPVMTLTNGAQSNIKTLNYSDMSGDTVKIDVTRDGLTDTITLVKVREGNDSIVGYLTNESVTVPADNAGTVASFTGAGGTFEVYQGLTRLTGIGITYSVPSLSGCSVSINPTSGVYTVNSMSADFGTATLRASLVVAGTTVTLDKVFTISKSRAGATGPGGSGTRGTVNVAYATTGSTWTDAAANTALSTAGYGSPQSRDIVTLYNTSTGFSESRFYNGASWVTLDAYINGNLLVSRTIAAAAIQAGAIGAEHINVGNGRNMLQNSAPSWKSTYGWAQGWNNTGGTMTQPQITTDRNPVGGRSAYVLVQGGIVGREFEIYNYGPGGIRYPVIGGQRYEFGACISVVGATSGQVSVLFYDAAGNPLGFGTASGNLVTTGQQNGVIYKDFNKSRGFTVAPSNAATCLLLCRGLVQSTTAAYIFASYAFIAPATDNQTTFSPWAEGGSTVIDGAGISTPNLSSISADIGKVTTGWVYGTVITGGSGYDSTTYDWPSNRGLGNTVSGFHLSSAGLLLGNSGSGKYFQVTGDGNVYAPGFSIINGAATFSGALSAASGTFNGNISAASGNISGTAYIADGSIYNAKIVNLEVDTIKIRNSSVSSLAGFYNNVEDNFWSYYFDVPGDTVACIIATFFSQTTDNYGQTLYQYISDGNDARILSNYPAVNGVIAQQAFVNPGRYYLRIRTAGYAVIQRSNRTEVTIIKK